MVSLRSSPKPVIWSTKRVSRAHAKAPATLRGQLLQLGINGRQPPAAKWGFPARITIHPCSILVLRQHRTSEGSAGLV